MPNSLHVCLLSSFKTQCVLVTVAAQQTTPKLRGIKQEFYYAHGPGSQEFSQGIADGVLGAEAEKT